MTYRIYFETISGNAAETKVRGKRNLEKTLVDMIESGKYRLISYEKKGEYGTVEYIDVLKDNMITF